MQRYQDGETLEQLAEAFDIHRRTAAAILERVGVQRRYRRLTPADIDEAATLYRSGLSLEAVGMELGVSAHTILIHLRRLGVARRSVGTNQWSDRPQT
ncbi:MAG: helix-turn-helix domain-containing protein [Acidobacteriota bacterium]